MRRATRGWGRATRWRSCSGTRRSTTAAICCWRSTGRARSTSHSRACRAGNAGRSNPPRSSRAKRPRAHGRSATTARTSSRCSPTSSTSRSRSPGCDSRSRSALRTNNVAYGTLDVYDVRKFGSLYARVVERVVIPDAARQQDGLAHAYHPWFPVLLIGSHKAELYTRALIGDIVHKKRNLADPGWLVRVGIYLELLTCIGIAEAVGEDLYGDLELPDLSDRLNVEGWKRVWALRQIAFGGPRTGPVGALNLLNKRRATLEFLHVHHEDLQHAIELAGPNVHNAQETWHRVFRDAERAVLRQTPDAFPELAPSPDRGATVGALAPARPSRPEPRPARARAAAAAARRPGRAVRVRVQPVPGVDEPRRGLGQAARADGPRRRGGRAAPGQPARGAHEPADPGRAAAAARRLRLRAARGRRGAAAGVRAADRRPREAAGRHARCSRSCARTRSTCSRTPRGRSRSARWSGSSSRARRATRCSWSSTAPSR